MNTQKFEIKGKPYTATFTKPQDSELILKALIAASGDSKKELSLKFIVKKELQEAWGLDFQEVDKFLLNFAKIYSKIRAAEDALIGEGEYIFDADFATIKPDNLIEKISKEWQGMEG